MANLNAQNRQEKAFASQVIFTLPRGGKMRRGVVILKGEVVISGGTTNGVKKGDGGPLNLLKHITITATPASGSRYPGGKIVDADVRPLMYAAMFNRSGKFFADLSGETLGDGAAGTYEVYLPVPIYFADPAQRYQLLTALNCDASAYASIQVKIDTGKLSDCFTGNDRTMDVSGLTVQWLDERFDSTSDTVVLYQESHELLIAATEKRALDAAMPQDGAFLSWQILAQLNAAQALDDGLLNQVVVESPTLDYNKYGDDIKEGMLSDEWVDPSQSLTGLYFMDFTDGAADVNSQPAASMQLYFDVNNVSGANLDSLSFFTRRIVAPAPAKSGS